MAKNKKGGKDDIIIISKEDWKGRGDFKTAPGGKYRFKFNTKSSKIVPNAAGDGNVLLLVSTLSAMHNGKKSEHKGINVFDRIAPHVGWKIAQILRALGVKKPPKKMTLKELLKLIQKYGKEVRIVIGKKMYNGKPQNPVLQYLPLDAAKDEDDDDIEDDDDENEDDDDSSDDDNDDDDDSDSDDDDDDSDDSDDDDDDDDEDEDDEEDDEDDDDDEDDEEDEKPRKKKGKKGKKK